MTRDGNALQNVVVATDFSPGAAAALGRVAWLPMRSHAALSIIHVVPDTVPKRLRNAVTNGAKSRLRKAAADVVRMAKIRGVAVEVTSAIASGIPHVEIVRHARTTAADLVVVGRHGARGMSNAFVGSTAERVVRKGDVPVLLVNERAAGPYRRALAAIDLSDTSRRITDLALALLPEKAEALRLVHAFHVAFEDWLSGDAREEYRREHQALATAALKKLAATRVPEGITCRIIVREGDPRTVVLRDAVRSRCDLIVAGTHARSGISHALLGSVAEWLVRAAPCDVAVTRPARFTFELP